MNATEATRNAGQLAISIIAEEEQLERFLFDPRIGQAARLNENVLRFSDNFTQSRCKQLQPWERVIVVCDHDNDPTKLAEQEVMKMESITAEHDKAAAA